VRQLAAAFAAYKCAWVAMQVSFDGNCADQESAASKMVKYGVQLEVVGKTGEFVHPLIPILGTSAWLLVAPALLFFYYLMAWVAIGREPKPATVVTRYQPPDGFSAAVVRYVVTKTTDGRSFAAVIAELAIRGYVRVEPQNGKYKVSRLLGDRATETKLASEEKACSQCFLKMARSSSSARRWTNGTPRKMAGTFSISTKSWANGSMAGISRGISA
jgi:hypothetical protein